MNAHLLAGTRPLRPETGLERGDCLPGTGLLGGDPPLPGRGLLEGEPPLPGKGLLEGERGGEVALIPRPCSRVLIQDCHAAPGCLASTNSCSFILTIMHQGRRGRGAWEQGGRWGRGPGSFLLLCNRGEGGGGGEREERGEGAQGTEGPRAEMKQTPAYPAMTSSYVRGATL